MSSISFASIKEKKIFLTLGFTKQAECHQLQHAPKQTFKIWNLLRLQLGGYSEQFTEGFDCGLTVVTTVWHVLNRISLLPEGAVSGYGGERGSCEQVSTQFFAGN